MKSKESNTAVKPIPEGFHTITPYLIVENASGLIDFITKAFNGQVTYIMKGEDNKQVIHATVKIGDSVLMISDIMNDMEPITAMLYLYVEDVDSIYKQALDAGGVSTRELRNEFYGDRAGAIKDAWGNNWWVSTHVEDVSNAELSRRKEQMSGQPA
jgi:PhnB protein